MMTIIQQESHGTTGREEATPGSLCLVHLLGYKGGKKNPNMEVLHNSAVSF